MWQLNVRFDSSGYFAPRPWLMELQQWNLTGYSSHHLDEREQTTH